MNRKVLIWGVLLLTVINVVSLATIGYHRLIRHRTRNRAHLQARIEALHRELDLSEAQAEQMKALRDSLRSNTEPLQASIRAKREHLFQLLMASEPDRAQIDAVRSELDSLQAEIQKRVVDHLLGLKEIFTPEQQSRFFSMIKTRFPAMRAGPRSEFRNRPKRSHPSRATID